MRKQISIFALTNTGSLVKHITVSGTFIFCLSFFIFISLVSFGFLLYDYVTAKQIAVNAYLIERKNSVQQEEIFEQRKQIQSLADKIEALRTKLISLKKFEKKIRVIANIEKTDEQNDFSGVGGSNPELFDTRIQVTKKHNSLIREMHEQLEEFDHAAEIQKNDFALLAEKLEHQQNILASTPAIRPIAEGWISSKFGYRISPFTGRKELHKGIDFATRKGDPIFATADGIVIFSGSKGLLGKAIIIDHGHGMSTRYGHACKILKKRGDRVKKGDIIALVGSTGRSTGPHVHYEVRLNGIPVNPEKFVLN
jgi:murein DD-endopeptidase MepM/ murein hydrolase activator NlpD